LLKTVCPNRQTWVATLPLVGERIATLWTQLAASGAAGIFAKITPYAADTGKWVLSQVGGLGGMLIQFLLVVIVAAILYASVVKLQPGWCVRFGRRLAGERGENSIILARSGHSWRGARASGVTAIVQTVLGGVGLAVAGVPFASLLSALMLMFCIAQIGPGLVLFSAVGWMYWTGDSGWATALLVWSICSSPALDNFLRPLLIKKGADLPLLLIFAGVIGGMLGFGLIGIFIGPVVLAVTYTLLLAWIEDELGKDELAKDEMTKDVIVKVELTAPLVAPPVSTPVQPDHSEPAAG
jgi:predicted PurR-regulated permease PerM